MSFKSKYCPKDLVISKIFTLLKKKLPFFGLATIVKLAVYCYQICSSILNQIIKNLTIDVGIVSLVFVNLKISRTTCNQSMDYLLWSNNIHHSAAPFSSTTQASAVDNFPVSIEVHESAMKNKLRTFIIPNQIIEQDLIVRSSC